MFTGFSLSAEGACSGLGQVPIVLLLEQGHPKEKTTVKTKIIGKETTTVKTKIIVAILLALFLLGLSASATGNEVLACEKCRGVGTPGFYKKEKNWGDMDSIWVGGRLYSRGEAIELLKSEVAGDKWVTLFKAYVAAKLNIALTTCCPDYCITADKTFGSTSTFHQAGNWLADFAADRPVPASSEAWQFSHGEGLYLRLDDYNNGKLCAPSRDLFD
jgi:hypothetical protein